jgi:formylglycine-generating enzyme required for sulfatase activity
MVVVPAGSFIMGSRQSDSVEKDPEFVEVDPTSRERPRHEVTLARPFAVSMFEVTFDDWDACSAAGACPDAPDSRGRGSMPVINVSWIDAQKYASWLTQLTGKDYRLLSEAEWEYVARAGTDTRYSWGNDIGKANANCDGCGSQSDLQQTAPVGSFRPNAFGIYDMHGNVWEWVEDTWHESYDGAPTDGSAWLQGGNPDLRIIRGGAWRNESYLVHAALRERRNIHVRFDTLGIRVARTLNP